jgi:hypothetical protein
MTSSALIVQGFNKMQISTFLSDEVRNKLDKIEKEVLKDSLTLLGAYRNKFNR